MTYDAVSHPAQEEYCGLLSTTIIFDLQSSGMIFYGLPYAYSIPQDIGIFIATVVWNMSSNTWYEQS
jgi:hypothetical protein